jgi:hypothetical protein
MIIVCITDDGALYSVECILNNYKYITVKLVLGGTAWDQKYFPHWTNFRIIQNK